VDEQSTVFKFTNRQGRSTILMGGTSREPAIASCLLDSFDPRQQLIGDHRDSSLSSARILSVTRSGPTKPAMHAQIRKLRRDENGPFVCCVPKVSCGTIANAIEVTELPAPSPLARHGALFCWSFMRQSSQPPPSFGARLPRFLR
jgi:hypothetical protein